MKLAWPKPKDEFERWCYFFGVGFTLHLVLQLVMGFYPGLFDVFGNIYQIWNPLVQLMFLIRGHGPATSGDIDWLFIGTILFIYLVLTPMFYSTVVYGVYRLVKMLRARYGR